MQLVGDYPKPSTILYAELIAIREDSGQFTAIPSDVIHDLTPITGNKTLPALDTKPADAFVRSALQIAKRKEILADRTKQQEIIRQYLTKSFDERLWAAQRKAMDLRGRLDLGEKDVEIALREAEQDVEDIERLRHIRLESLDCMGVVRTGPVRHIGSLYVLPPGALPEAAPMAENIEAKRASELAAMRIVMDHETARGWETQDVSAQKIGFDIRSLSPPDPQTGKREVRRIEVKGRNRGEPIRLTENEWRKAKQLRDTYWLYVVWNPTCDDRELVPPIQNPSDRFANSIKEIKVVSMYEISAYSITNQSIEVKNR